MRWRLSNPKSTGTVDTSEAKSTDVPSEWPNRACCCPAQPMVKVVLPANEVRRRPVDLYLCGHHYRVSRDALCAANATVYDARGRIDQLAVLADLVAVE